ncbi:hypothetical protein PENTCL1PPCAC_30324, partial [Pristionchus entomophagus]
SLSLPSPFRLAFHYLRNDCEMVPTDIVSSYMEWQELAKILKPGDLIEFSRYGSLHSCRGVYQHWAVYVGILKGVHHVIHYSNEDLSSESKGWKFMEISGNVEVQFETLEKVASQCQGRKNNGWDDVYEPLPVTNILECAKKMVGDKGYSLPTNNCEHFAHLCRYGKKRSGQVTKTAAVGIGGVLLGVAATVLYSKL